MAIRKIIELEGKSFIQSPLGTIQTGVGKASFQAICKITSITGDKTQLKVTVLHSDDVSKYERTYGFEPSVADGSANFIMQAYLHLKTLPEFAGAEDC